MVVIWHLFSFTERLSRVLKSQSGPAFFLLTVGERVLPGEINGSTIHKGLSLNRLTVMKSPSRSVVHPPLPRVPDVMSLGTRGTYRDGMTGSARHEPCKTRARAALCRSPPVKGVRAHVAGVPGRAFP